MRKYTKKEKISYYNNRITDRTLSRKKRDKALLRHRQLTGTISTKGFINKVKLRVPKIGKNLSKKYTKKAHLKDNNIVMINRHPRNTHDHWENIDLDPRNYDDMGGGPDGSEY